MELTLKPQAEMERLLEGIERVALLACKCCFKEFVTDRSDGVEDLEKAIIDSGRELVCVEEMDFICNSRSTEQALAKLDLSGVDAIVTYSCGIGTQTLAALTEKLVLPFSNSEGYTAFGGFYPTDTKHCRACGQCVLNETAGICPVAYCAKGLLNGPCGGAKGGKCEVSKEKDCIWLKIYERLNQQGRLDAMRGEARTRDYGRPSFKQQQKLAAEATERRAESFPGGVHPLEEKDLTAGLAIRKAAVPKVLVVPLSQHIGVACEPLVAVGDTVKMGQVIGKSDAFVSAPIHSPVSGKVLAVEARPHPVISVPVKAIVIENDGQDTLDDSCKGRAASDVTPRQILEIVRDKGIVGMGGAMFPTHVKIKPNEKVETLILNGCECEPWLTADHRMMVEQAGKIVEGMKLTAKALGIGRCIIAVEENKPDAAEALKAAAGEEVEVQVLPTKYPQGAERMLVYKLTGRTVPKGGLPLDVGCVVSNVSTCVAICEAVTEGLPLIKRVMTLTGSGLTAPGNYEVRIGTLMSDLLAPLASVPAGELPTRRTVKMGGPMMGLVQRSLNVPVVKGTTGITVLPQPEVPVSEERVCIRCGRCMEVCPMDLKPQQLWYYVKEQDWAKLAELGANDCIECGCCEYLCSTKLPLVSMIKTAKQKLRELNKK